MPMCRCRTRALYAAAAAGAALSVAGVSGVADAAAAQVKGPPVYDTTWSGYVVSGRWFRFITATVTVPGRVLPANNGGNAYLELSNAATSVPTASIKIDPGGGKRSVTWAAYPTAAGTFRLNPAVGDRLSLSIYYDRHGRDYFTAADLSQHITRTARVTVGTVAYTRANLAMAEAGTVTPPAADVRLWQFRNSHLTTYTGKHGTVRGPWTTRVMIQTSTGTSAGRVITSPSCLWHGGANFGIWLRHH